MERRWCALGVVALLLTGLVGWGCGGSGSIPDGGADAGDASVGASDAGGGDAGSASCPAGPVLAMLPVALEDLNGISPLGGLNPPAHTLPTYHTYLVGKNDGPVERAVPVRFPADAVLSGATRYDSPGLVEYSVAFSPCPELLFYFDHLRQPPPALQARFGDFDAGACSQYVDVAAGGVLTTTCRLYWGNAGPRVTAGEAAGARVIPAHATTPMLDFGARDARLPAPAFANPARFYTHPDHFDLQHVACPYDYLPADQQAAVAALLGNGFATPPVPRTTPPACGTIVEDLPGTAQGDWFAVPSPASAEDAPPPPEGQAVALVPYSFDGTTPVFSIGTFTNLGAGTSYVAVRPGGRVNRRFADVAADAGVYCYEHLVDAFGAPAGSGVVLLEVPTSTTLRLERVAGRDACDAGPWSFGAGVTELIR